MNNETKHKFICAQCGAECYGEYWTIADNFIQRNYFEEQDGSDNVFCSETCLLDNIMALSVAIDEETDK